jgi:hypothetical protein
MGLFGCKKQTYKFNFNTNVVLKILSTADPSGFPTLQ